MVVNQANMQDALNIGQARVMVNGEEWGFVSGLTVDGKAPETLVTVFGGKLRRQEPYEYDWAVDAVTLYGNLDALQELANNGTLFQIVVDFTNPNGNDTSNRGGTLTLLDCRVDTHNISMGATSTFKMSGKFRAWTYTSK